MDLRGFYGDYDVIIRYQGRPIKTQHFSLRNEDDEQEIRLTVDGNGGEIKTDMFSPETGSTSGVNITVVLVT